MTTLRELVDSPDLGLAVVHAAHGLDCEIRRAHVTELPDPRTYLQADEVVLTNGLWCRDEEDCVRFVEALVSRSIWRDGLRAPQ